MTERLEEIMAEAMLQVVLRLPGSRTVTERQFCEALLGAAEILTEPWAMRLEEIRKQQEGSETIINNDRGTKHGEDH